VLGFCRWALEIVKRTDDGTRFKLLPRRWVVERTFSWLTKSVTILVNGDRKKESNETFDLDLFDNSSNSLFTKKRGLGTFLNDDRPRD
jgi:Transposase DDE domain